jgi:hypothetical protein
MNAHPVNPAIVLVLLAIGALAGQLPGDTTTGLQTKPAIAKKIPAYEIGLNAIPVQLPTQVVHGPPDHTYQDLNTSFQYAKMAESHALYQKALTNRVRVAVLLPPEEGSNHVADFPLLRSSW